MENDGRSLPESRSRVAANSITLQLPQIGDPLAVAVDRHRPDWGAQGFLQGDTLTLPYEAWLAAGSPSFPTNETEERDYWLGQWAAAHDVLCSLAGLQEQRLEFRLVGYFGAPAARLQLRVDGQDVPMDTGEGFMAGARGAHVALAPIVEQVRAQVSRFPKGDRQGQLLSWASIRAQLEILPSHLSTRLSVTYDAHLKDIEPVVPERFSLEWQERGPKGHVTLTTKALRADGTSFELPYDKFDSRGIVCEDVKRPILVPAEVASVMEAARRYDYKPAKAVQREMLDPGLVVPEGIDVDRYFDLSRYSERVAGFELIQRTDSSPKSSSGVRWFEGNPALSSAFARLYGEDAETGERRAFEIDSPDAATRLLEENDSALAHDAPRLTLFPVRPSEELGAHLAALLKVTHRTPALPPAAKARVGTDVAIIKDLAAHEHDLHGPAIDESTVPWATLEAAFKPGITLKPHQRRGIAWLWHHLAAGTPGVLLADEMGLGKTLQTAALLVLRSKDRPSARHLVLCPTVLLENWLRELETFFGLGTFRSPAVLHGQSLRKLTHGSGLDVAALEDSQLVLTNYETLARHQRSILQVDFDLVLFDEAQQIKNPDTLRSRAARGLKRQFAIAMTGTPVENGLSDLWAIYDAAQTRQERAFGTKEEFERAYVQPSSGIAMLRTRLCFPSAMSSLLRREKTQALKDLPPKVEKVHSAEMSPEQLELERVIQKEARSRGALSALQMLRQLYQHPFLLQGDGKGLSVATAVRPSPKVALLLSLLKDIQSKGEKALVFTLSLRMQDVLAELFRRELGLPSVNIINGDPARRARAQESIDGFTDSQGFNVLILSPIAAGVGLTITAATHVIHFERWWNPAKEDQATDRAHRIGQTRTVTVHYPLLHRPGQPMAGFDMRLHELVTRKRQLARDFLAPTEALEMTAADAARVLTESPT